MNNLFRSSDAKVVIWLGNEIENCVQLALITFLFIAASSSTLGGVWKANYANSGGGE